MNIIKVNSARITNINRPIENSLVVFIKENKTYLGLSRNYDNHGNYNNNDNSLYKVSDNSNCFYLLSGSFIKSSKELIENGYFLKEDFEKVEKAKKLYAGNLYNNKNEKEGLWIEFNNESFNYTKGFYVDGEKQGIWTEYYENGKLYSTQNYTDNRKDGIYKQYTKDEKIKYTEEWEYGEQLNSIDYYSNGQIQIVKQYRDGIKNGIAESFYETGELKKKYNYKNDKLNGSIYTYNKAGNIIKQETYSNGNLIKNNKELIDYNEFKDLLNLDKRFIHFNMTDKEIDYYSNLEKNFLEKIEKISTEFIIHKEHFSFSIHKDPKGNEWNLTVISENTPLSDTRGNYKKCFDELLYQIKYEELFIELARQKQIINLNNLNQEGKKEGLWIIPRQEDFIQKEICYFKNGNLDGKFAKIFDNNEVAEIGTYRNNVKEGKAFSYYSETLNLQEEKNYENGILNGKYKNFLYTGELYCEGNLKNGKFDGILKSYHIENKKLFLWQIMEYKNGLEHGVATNFFPNGNIKEKFNMKEGNLYGESIKYYENGNIKEKSYYITKNNNSLRDGEYKLFDPNGTLIEKLKYQEGKIIENLLKKDNLWEKTDNKENSNNSWEEKTNENNSSLER